MFMGTELRSVCFFGQNTQGKGSCYWLVRYRIDASRLIHDACELRSECVSTALHASNVGANNCLVLNFVRQDHGICVRLRKTAARSCAPLKFLYSGVSCIVWFWEGSVAMVCTSEILLVV